MGCEDPLKHKVHYGSKSAFGELAPQDHPRAHVRACKPIRRLPGFGRAFERQSPMLTCLVPDLVFNRKHDQFLPSVRRESNPVEGPHCANSCRLTIRPWAGGAVQDSFRCDVPDGIKFDFPSPDRYRLSSPEVQTNLLCYADDRWLRWSRRDLWRRKFTIVRLLLFGSV